MSDPDLLQNLFLLLLRCRDRPIAVIADIEAMFMQISITEKDQAALRFLLLTGNFIRQYQYTRLIFGAACSPTTAISARKRSADDFAADDVATKQLIHNAFYMDDLVHSFLNLKRFETCCQSKGLFAKADSILLLQRIQPYLS